MKKLFTILSVLTIASVVFAEIDYKAMKKIKRIQQGKESLDNPTAITINAKNDDDGIIVEGVTLSNGVVTGDIVGEQPIVPVTISTSTNITITSTSYGRSILLNTNAAVTVTLPANGATAGSWFEVAIIGNDSCAPVISAATADTLIGPNDVDLDSVTWATGHRINALARFWSDGSFWHVQNLGGTTMTYTD